MEGKYLCSKCDYKTRKEESLKQHMESQHAKVPSNNLIQQMINQTQVFRSLEKEAMVNKELLQKSESEIVQAKIDF